MKILYWAQFFWPELGGMEVQAMKTLPRLRDRGHQLVVIASHGRTEQPDLIDHSGIPVHRFPFWTALVERDLRSIHAIQRDVSRLVEDFKPDLLHVSFSGYTAYFQLMATKAYPLPMVIRLASSVKDCNAGEESILGRLLRKADWVATVSEATLADLRHVIPEIADTSSAIHTGLEPPSLPPESLPFDPPRIVCLGRLAREKGFDLLLQAVASLLGRYPHLRVTVAGDGPERQVLEQEVRTLHLEKVVTFTGAVEIARVPDVLNSGTMVVLPSRFRDPFPLVALEAAQMARPIVAARVGGIPESVIHGETGVVVEPENPAAIAGAIADLLDDPEAARRMGQAGRERVLHRFGFERSVTEYDSPYRRTRRECEARRTNQEMPSYGIG